MADGPKPDGDTVTKQAASASTPAEQPTEPQGSETEPQAPVTPETPAEPKAEQPEGEAALTMTQAEFDAKIQERLRRSRDQQRREFEQWLETEASKAGLTEEQQQALTAAEQKAAAEIDKVRGQVTRAEAKAAAAAAGVAEGNIDKVLRLADLSAVTFDEDGQPDATEIRSAVQQVLADVPELGGTRRPTVEDAKALSGGEHNQNDTKTWTRSEIAALSPDEYAKHRDDITAAMRSGRVVNG